MKSNLTSTFLEKYRELERALRENLGMDNGMSSGPVAYYEQGIKDEEVATKLHHVRIIRNTITHNPGLEGFVGVTQENIKFLEEMIHRVESLNGIVKDEYKTLAKSCVLKSDNTLQEACEMFANKKTDLICVLVNEISMCYLTHNDVVQAFAKGGFKNVKLDKFKDLEKADITVDISCPLSKVPEHEKPIPVTKSGKIVGILK